MDNEPKDFENSNLEDLIQDLSEEKMLLDGCYDIFQKISRRMVIFSEEENEYPIDNIYSILNECHIIAHVINNDDFNDTLKKIYVGLHTMEVITIRKLSSEYTHYKSIVEIILLYDMVLISIKDNIYHLKDILSKKDVDDFTISVPADIDIYAHTPHSSTYGAEMTTRINMVCDILSKVTENMCNTINQSRSYFNAIVPLLKEKFNSSKNDEEDK